MTDLKKLRELAVGSMADLPPSPVIRKEDLVLAKARIDFCAACHPQAIIEILDMVDRYREALTTIKGQGVESKHADHSTLMRRLDENFEIAREALGGGK